MATGPASKKPVRQVGPFDPGPSVCFLLGFRECRTGFGVAMRKPHVMSCYY